jgi:hypothetical protein
MATKKRITVGNLAALGTDRFAEIRVGLVLSRRSRQ